MSVASKQQQLLETFSAIPDPQEKLSAVIVWSKRVPRFSSEERNSSNRVPGCVSPVWVHVEKRDCALQVRADADSPVVRGLVCLLCEVYDGAEASEIADTETSLLADLGLIQGLSVTRRNGLAAVRQRLRERASQITHRPT